jgi:phosphopantetheine--protein transferase-like protein
MIHTGIDIVYIPRFEKMMNDPAFVSKIFCEEELPQKIESLAGIFALKESFFKATQIKLKSWKEITVKKDKNKKPYILFDETKIYFKIKSVDCSIAHDGDYAIAQVVILEDQPD